MTPNELAIAIYNVALLPVIFFSVLFLFLTIVNLFVDRNKTPKIPKLKKYPFVTVQLPTFNGSKMAIRAAKHCLAFNYPKDRYEIMFVDDSTDKSVVKELRSFAKKHGIGFYHRDNRVGYKPGALKEVMKYVKGEIVVIFDEDFTPKKDYLTHIVKPFENPKIAIVQGRQAISNERKNLITRFAAYLLQVFHYIIMPINHRMNSVLFCGTAGAIRVKALNQVGGWNIHSITEDTDLGVRLLARGWKNVYLPFETGSEVPVTLESFLKQQMRWCFGSTRVFFDHKAKILGPSKLGIRQRLMILFLTLGNLVAPAVILMTIAGFLGWFTGDLRIFGLSDVADFALKFFYTAGFLSMGFLMFLKRKSLSEFPHFLLAVFSVSLILAASNTVAIYKAIFQKDKPLYGKQNSWIRTPKVGNLEFK